MSYREQFIAAWVTQQQRAFHQSTRGIMTPEERQILEDEAEKAMVEIERDADLAAVERLRVLAYQHRSVEQHNEMVPMSDIADLIREPSSAEYLAALDGAPEPEWEYEVRNEVHDFKSDYTSDLEQAKRWAQEDVHDFIVRRRKAGPWQVCK